MYIFRYIQWYVYYPSPALEIDLPCHVSSLNIYTKFQLKTNKSNSIMEPAIFSPNIYFYCNPGQLVVKSIKINIWVTSVGLFKIHLHYFFYFLNKNIYSCNLHYWRYLKPYSNAPVPLCRIYCRTRTNVKSKKFAPILLCLKGEMHKVIFKSTKIIWTPLSST